VGTWGPGSFENDAALDWVLELGKSADPDLPAGVLRKLDGARPVGGVEEEVGIAAAEAVAASRGWPADRAPDGLLEWLGASGARADTGTAELALRVIDAIAGGDSDLGLRWREVGDASPWYASVTDLRRRLRAPLGDVGRPASPAKTQNRTGDVVQVILSAARVAYVQLIGRTDRPVFDLLRVVPGLFSPPVSDGSLAVLIGGDTAFLSQGSFSAILATGRCLARGNYPVPGSCAGPQPLKLRLPGTREPGAGPVRYKGQRFSAEKFAHLHPDIDQTMLCDATTIPSPGKLLRMIEREWRPWMGNDDSWMYPEDGEKLQQPRRPAPYPSTAQPEKFLLS
jgi:Domain of unknown function (DUF4259)